VAGSAARIDQAILARENTEMKLLASDQQLPGNLGQKLGFSGDTFVARV
jgi:hypothetical protein